MKLLIQRVKKASVTVNEEEISKIRNGLLVFIGIKNTDSTYNADYLVKKITNLRIFEDENNKMNLSLKDINGELLIVSQFTLYGDCEKGNRPSFTDAAKPNDANELYEYFCDKCKETGISVKQGKFKTHMEVKLTNDGPVTIIIEK